MLYIVQPKKVCCYLCFNLQYQLVFYKRFFF